MKIKLEDCVEFMILGVKHNERRNGARCAAYWSVTNLEGALPSIYDNWFVRGLRKSIAAELEKAPPDPINYGIKRGFFKVHALLPQKFIRGNSLEPKWIFSIEHMPDTRGCFIADFVKGKNKYGPYVPTKFRATDMKEAIKKVNEFLRNDIEQLNSLKEVNEDEYKKSNVYVGYIN